MAVNSKRKGADGERELAKKLNEYGFSTRRSVQYNGKADDGKADLVNLPGIHIECKRVERLNVSEAMTQAINDAKDEISGLAMAIAGKVVGRELNDADQSKLIDSFIDELGGNV